MLLRYIDGPEVRITANDKIFVDIEFFHTGEKYTGLEVKRMFPISGGDRYLALIDEDGNEQAMIRSLDTLDEESRNVVQNCLKECYMIPKILKFTKMTEKFKIWMWYAETDKGDVVFEIRNHITAVKVLYDNRVLIKDANDNRYEIPDYTKLDRKSRKLIVPKL